MLCYEFPPIGGGGAGVVHGLSRELVRMGHGVDLVTMGFRDLPRRETVEGVEVHRVPCLRRYKSNCSVFEAATYLARAERVAASLVEKNDYAVNHTHFIMPDGWIARRLHRRTGLPYILTAHGSDVPGYNPHQLRSLHVLLKPFWKDIVDHAHTLICPSETLRSLASCTGTDARMQVIPNGIDTARFEASSQKRKRLLIVTRMVERKGVQHVLRAMEGLDPEYELHVVGDGPYLDALKKQAAGRKINVKFWGWMDNLSPELKELFTSSRIFLLPSQTENFPVVLLEAMASGLAVITSERTGCAEVVGDTGMLIPAGDVEAIRYMLEKLIADPSLCRAMGETARRRVESQFDWSVIAGRYVEVYESAARSNQPVS